MHQQTVTNTNTVKHVGPGKLWILPPFRREADCPCFFRSGDRSSDGVVAWEIEPEVLFPAAVRIANLCFFVDASGVLRQAVVTLRGEVHGTHELVVQAAHRR